jgi:hypothetical protein
MILRRVIAHVRKQEWTAIFLDFVIVVLGVFMGFQITDLTGRRADRAAEVRHVEEIAEDLRADLEMFEQIQIGARARIGAVDYLLREARNETLPAQIVLSTDVFAATGEQPDPAEGRSNLLGRANLVRTSYGNRTGFEALIGSGDLKLIRDRAIGRQIQKYYASFDDLWNTQAMMREIRNDGVAAGYALGLSAFGEVAEEQLIDIVRGSDAYAAYLKTSREWAAIQLGMLDEQARRARALLTSIDEYLDGRGAP